MIRNSTGGVNSLIYWMHQSQDISRLLYYISSRVLYVPEVNTGYNQKPAWNPMFKGPVQNDPK